MMIRPDPHRRLLRALSASALRNGLSITPCIVAERPWSSATFTGCRLTLDIMVSGDAAAAWLDRLAEEDLPVPGQLVADLCVRHRAAGVACVEVLLLET